MRTWILLLLLSSTLGLSKPQGDDIKLSSVEPKVAPVVDPAATGTNRQNAGDAALVEEQREEEQREEEQREEEQREEAKENEIEDEEKEEKKDDKGGFGLGHLAARVPQIWAGGIVGAAVGTMVGAGTVGLSGGDYGPVEIMSQFWSGALGGAYAAIKANEVEPTSESRMKHAKTNMGHGAAIGFIAGALTQGYSGSSDQDGSSASSSSSLSSSQNPAVDKRDIKQTNPCLISSGNTPILHTILAGAAGAAAVGYLSPELDLLVGHAARALDEHKDKLIEKTKKAYHGLKKAAQDTNDALRDIDEFMTESDRVMRTAIERDRKEAQKSVRNFFGLAPSRPSRPNIDDGVR